MPAAPSPSTPPGRDPSDRYADPEALERRAREVLAGDTVTAATRRAFASRLQLPAAGGVLAAPQRATLAAVAARLLPLGALGHRIDLAARADHLLAQGPGDGWRYADMPADRQAWIAGLDALEASAAAAHDRAFIALAPDEQDRLLRHVQAGDPPGPPWPLPPARWFEEVLAALTELAYGDLRLLVAIGYDGFADADGWQGDPLTAAGADRR